MSVSEVIWYAELVEQHILTRACIQLDYSHTAGSARQYIPSLNQGHLTM